MTGPTPGDAVVIERTFAEPAALIWRMWTDPEHFSAWYGPPGAAVSVIAMDVRVGGQRRVGMRVQTPNGEMQMWFTGEHLEVMTDRRLVYTESVSDDDGLAVPHHTTTVTVELREAAGRTTVRLTHAGIPADSPGATGWQMALDKLERHLATGTGRS